MIPPLPELLIPSIFFLIAIVAGKHIELSDTVAQAFSNTSLGAVLSILAIQFIPLIKDLKPNLHRKKVVLGFITTLVFMLAVHYFVKDTDDNYLKKNNNNNTNYIIRCLPLFFAFFIDGLILGINIDSYTTTFGIFLAIILSIDNIFIGFDLGNKQKKDKISSIIATLCILFLFLAVPTGCFIGNNISQNIKNSSWLYFIIAIGICSLIWEIFQEQIPGLFYRKRTKINKYINATAFYIGFVGVLLAEWANSNNLFT